MLLKLIIIIILYIILYQITEPKKIVKKIDLRRIDDDTVGTNKIKELLFFDKAELAAKNNLYATATTYFSKAIEINPKPLYYMLRAYSNSAGFNFAKSVDDIDRAILLEPNSSFAYRLKGDLLWRSFRISEAIEAYKYAQELGEKGLENIIADLRWKKTAWLPGANYIDHYHILNWHEYYSQAIDMKSLKVNSELIEENIYAVEKTSQRNEYCEFCSFNQQIAYLNGSTYKLFLN